ncbi:hypothetical protein EYC80_005426 [Monilinia laxa]|uniref:Uncharacterized protein n=1 Tax=Monilinia laxa TaxID=61186 RepID=A0A5N6KK68_MONLA|nr:hypothetical protein EYC80_005426 [Monilinia laxa]
MVSHIFVYAKRKIAKRCQTSKGHIMITVRPVSPLQRPCPFHLPVLPSSVRIEYAKKKKKKKKTPRQKSDQIKTS